MEIVLRRRSMRAHGRRNFVAGWQTDLMGRHYVACLQDGYNEGVYTPNEVLVAAVSCCCTIIAIKQRMRVEHSCCSRFFLRPTGYQVQQYVPGTRCTVLLHRLYLLVRFYLGRIGPYCLHPTSLAYFSVRVYPPPQSSSCVLF